MRANNKNYLSNTSQNQNVNGLQHNLKRVKLFNYIKYNFKDRTFIHTSSILYSNDLARKDLERLLTSAENPKLANLQLIKYNENIKLDEDAKDLGLSEYGKAFP
jgi:hypothetical protein